jgi:hypothetical protein
LWKNPFLFSQFEKNQAQPIVWEKSIVKKWFSYLIIETLFFIDF